jgi:hypothetical protein
MKGRIMTIRGWVLLAMLLFVGPVWAQGVPSTPLMAGPTQIAEEVGRLIGMADACQVPVARRDAVAGSTQTLLRPRGVPESDSLRLLRLGAGRGANERNTRNLDCNEVRRSFSNLEADLARQLRR